MRKQRMNKTEAYQITAKPRLMKMRKQPAVVRIDKPTNIQKARALGYKAKQGVSMARVRIKKGGRKSRTIKRGRRAKHHGRVKFTAKLSKQVMAEQRVADKHPNLEVLNSYEIADDGKYKWYEVILIDPSHPVVKKDPNLKKASERTRRVYRGLTSAGKKSRGLRNKGKGAEKIRPSVNKGKHK